MSFLDQDTARYDLQNSMNGREERMLHDTRLFDELEDDQNRQGENQ